MPEGKTSVRNMANSIADGASKQKSVSSPEEENSVKHNKLFGREKPVHNILGGGKCRDCYLHISFPNPCHIFAHIILCFHSLECSC